jgi:hypothetical protein
MGELSRVLLAWVGLGDRTFRDAATKAFGSLARDYDLAAPTFEADVFGAALTYRGTSVAINVTWDKQENLVEVYVVRLRNGELPLLVEEPQDWIYLSALIKIRAPELVPLLTQRTSRSLSSIDRILKAAADALRAHGDDALRGDPAVFAEIFAHYPQIRKRREWFASK